MSEPTGPQVHDGLDDVIHDDLDALQARDDAAQESELEDAQFRQWERIGTERITAYAEAIRSIGEILYPPHAADGITPRKPARMDALVKGGLELALRAMATDIRRLAGQTGPKPPTAQSEE